MKKRQQQQQLDRNENRELTLSKTSEWSSNFLSRLRFLSVYSFVFHFIFLLSVPVSVQVSAPCFPQSVGVQYSMSGCHPAE